MVGKERESFLIRIADEVFGRKKKHLSAKSYCGKVRSFKITLRSKGNGKVI